jgi:hypothetical protein
VALCDCPQVRGMLPHRLMDMVNQGEELRRRQSVKIVCPECYRHWHLSLQAQSFSKSHKIPPEAREA